MKRIVVFFTLLLLAFGGNKALAQDKKDWGNIYVDASFFYSMGDVTGNGIFENVSVKYRLPETPDVIYLSWGVTNKELKLGYPQMHTVMVGIGTDVLRFKKTDSRIKYW